MQAALVRVRKTYTVAHNAISHLRFLSQRAGGLYPTTPLSAYVKVFGKRDDADLSNKLAGVNEELKTLARQASASMTEEERFKAARAARKAERKAQRHRDQEHPFNGYQFNVVVVGRPNVGKSTLFNRLVGKPSAIVDGSSGVTRDWKEDDAYLAGLKFRLLDTAGLDEVDWEQATHMTRNDHFGSPIKASKRSGFGLSSSAEKKQGAPGNRDARGLTAKYALGRPLTPELQQQILLLTKQAVEAADLILYVADVRTGLTPLDHHFARWLRRCLTPPPLPGEEQAAPGFNSSSRGVLRRVHTKPVVLIANKYDYGGDDVEDALLEMHSLGLGEPVAFSATHASGFGELFSRLTEAMSDVLKQWAQFQAKAMEQAEQRRAEEKRVEEEEKKRLEGEQKQKRLESTAATHASTFTTSSSQTTTSATPQPSIPLVTAQKRLTVAEAATEVAAKEEGEEQQEEKESSDELPSAPLPTQSRRAALRARAPGRGTLVPVRQSTAMEEDDDVASATRSAGASVGAGAGAGGAEVTEDAWGPGPGGVHSLLRVDTVRAVEGAVPSKSKTKSRGAKRMEEEEVEEEEEEEWEGEEEEGLEGEESKGEEGPELIRVCIAGKPNVGKSTLINAMLRHPRLLTGPQPGVTRDSVTVEWSDDRFPNHRFELVDTAGMKGTSVFSHSKFDRVDSMAMATSLRALRSSHVVVLVLDIADGLYGISMDPAFRAQIHRNFIESATRPLNARAKQMKGRETLGKRSALHAAAAASRGPDRAAYEDRIGMMVQRVAGAVSKHDLDVAAEAVKEGKALVIVANKIDLLQGGPEEVRAVLRGLAKVMESSLSQNKGVTIIGVSALSSESVQDLPSRIVHTYDRWNTRISTGLLNRWLRALTALKPPPNIGGRPVKLKYITQTCKRPPTFSIFCSRKNVLPDDYKNFLVNSLRDEFGLQGVPVRLNVRAGKNPYTEAAQDASGKGKGKGSVSKSKTNGKGKGKGKNGNNSGSRR